MSLDKRLQLTRQSWWHEQFERCRGAAAVVLVEGDTDERFVSALIRRADVAVVVMGSRTAVLKALDANHLPGEATFSGRCLALVDRDLWTEHERDAQMALRPGRLFVTPGWCLESSFLDEDHIQAAAQLLNEEVKHGLDIDRPLPTWVEGGAWARVLQARRERLGLPLRAFQDPYGHPPRASITDPAGLAPLFADLRQTLADTAAERLLAEVQQTNTLLQSLNRETQLQVAIHGKAYWTHVVEPQLLRLRPRLNRWHQRFAPLLRAERTFADLCSALPP